MSATSTNKRDVIRRVRIFSGLGDTDCDAILAVIKARRGAAGDVLFRQGEPGSSMILVADGMLAARMRRDSGAETEIARFGPGEVVGEMAALDPAPRSATVYAAQASTVYEFGRDALDLLRKDAPPVASAIVRAVIRDVARRLRAINEQIEKQIDGAEAVRVAAESRRSVTAERVSLPGGPLSMGRPSAPPGSMQGRDMASMLDRVRGRG
jgi:CRP-like cAMP-binding protein